MKTRLVNAPTMGLVIAALLVGLVPGTQAWADTNDEVTAPSDVAGISAEPGGSPVELESQPVDDPASAQRDAAVEEAPTQADCVAEAARAREAGEAEESTCVSVELDPDPDPVGFQQRSAAASALLPECQQSSTPNRGWYASSRRQACTHRQFNLTVTRVPSGQVVGTANIHATMEMTASGTTWTSSVYTWLWSYTGTGRPQSASGNLFGCSGCAGTSSFSPSGLDGWSGNGSFSKTGLAAGAIQSGLSGRWQLTFSNSQWSNGSVAVNLDLASYRCDNAIGNRPAGCVLPTITGVVGFSQNQNPAFVQHVYNAQLSGLPGRLGSGTYLKRLSNTALVNQNGATACPSSLTRPTGYQCDEYPFRSTYQGASTGGGSARTQPWCQMPGGQATGPTGFSRCFIPSGQNLSAGGILGGFYSNERILDGDRFQVGYLP